MTREEAIEILIAVAVCDRPILSCDFCARHVGMGTDCTYPSDKEIEEAVLLLKGASNDAAISASRRQDHFREVTKKVEPLTLDELREAAETGDPVWLVGMEDGDGWVFIHHVDSCSVRYARIGTSEEWCFRTKSYGVRVWAYRQKPEEDDHDERKEN